MTPEDTDSEGPEQRPGRATRLRASLAGGLPVVLVAALAALVLVAILLTVAETDRRGPRGWAEFTVSPGGCSIDPHQHLNGRTCLRQGPGAYRLFFDADLTGSTVIASRGSCCAGSIAASIVGRDSVLVVVERRVRGRIRASVLIP